MTERKDWKLFTGSDTLRNIERWPEPPPWRRFDGPVLQERTFGQSSEYRGRTFQTTPPMVEMVNAALYLRRPLLLTGRPGSGKSSLIEAVAWELGLGPVLVWSITSRSTLQQALYQYDALSRLQEQQRTKKTTDIGKFLELGPLGTALLPTSKPRCLLIDEIDKSDIDLPNDLLNAFERGDFHIPELSRLGKDKRVEVRGFDGREKFPIIGGHVVCREFPFVVLTSNGEREFPAPFLRRCVRFTMPAPKYDLLTRIVKAHLGESVAAKADAMIRDFERSSENTAQATDQLLNAIFLITRDGAIAGEEERKRVLDAVLKELATPKAI